MLTGHNEGLLQRLSAAPRRSSFPPIKYGYLYQGQWCRWQQQARAARPRCGLPAGGLRQLPPEPRSDRQLGPRLALPRDERGLYRHDKRDLRRQASVHAARLRCPGLERGGGSLPRVKTAPLDPAVTMDEAEALSMPFASDRAPVPGHLFGQRGCLPPSQGTSVFDVVSQFSHPTLFGSPATLHVSSSPDGLPLLGGRQDQVRRQAYGFTQNRQDARLVYLTDLL